ncbi:MAG: hypothetical protein IJV43_01310, partial [Oscillospiraceae bacterium]|nr:hypothetical protein [Oscillospiraceae bacterium]
QSELRRGNQSIGFSFAKIYSTIIAHKSKRRKPVCLAGFGRIFLRFCNENKIFSLQPLCYAQRRVSYEMQRALRRDKK